MGATYGQNEQFGAKTGLGAPNWWNQVEQGWDKSGHVPGDALEPFLWSGRAIWVCQRAAKQGPKQPKTAFFGHKRI